MSNSIKISCYRSGPNWPQTTSADLATAITSAASMTPLTWREFKTAAVAAGATEAELLQLYQTGPFYERFIAAIEAGNLAEVNDCKSEFNDIAANFGITLSAASKQAANSVLQAAEITLIEMVAAELSEVAPQTVTAADVDAALGR